MRRCGRAKAAVEAAGASPSASFASNVTLTVCFLTTQPPGGNLRRCRRAGQVQDRAAGAQGGDTSFPSRTRGGGAYGGDGGRRIRRRRRHGRSLRKGVLSVGLDDRDGRARLTQNTRPGAGCWRRGPRRRTRECRGADNGHGWQFGRPWERGVGRLRLKLMWRAAACARAHPLSVVRLDNRGLAGSATRGQPCQRGPAIMAGWPFAALTGGARPRTCAASRTLPCRASRRRSLRDSGERPSLRTSSGSGARRV